MRVPGRRALVIGLAVSAVLLGVGGCSTSTTMDHSGGSPASTPSAWVRGTHVTLTNDSGKGQAIATYVGSLGDFQTLADGQSVSATDEWSGASTTGVSFLIKAPEGASVGLLLQNPSIGNPYTNWCWDRQDCNQPGTNWVGPQNYDENETQTLAVKDAHGATVYTFTVTRGADDDDNKNWTVSLK